MINMYRIFSSPECLVLRIRPSVGRLRDFCILKRCTAVWPDPWWTVTLP